MKSKRMWFVIGVLVLSNALTAFGLANRSAVSDDLATVQAAAEIIAQERSQEIIKKVDDQTLEVGAVTLRFEGHRLTDARAW